MVNFNNACGKLQEAAKCGCRDPGPDSFLGAELAACSRAQQYTHCGGAEAVSVPVQAVGGEVCYLGCRSVLFGGGDLGMREHWWRSLWCRVNR